MLRFLAAFVPPATALLLASALVPADAQPRAERVDVTVPGSPPVTLYAEESGEGPPILLLHGLGASTFTWRHVVKALAQRHRVIALDMKGFGRSEKPLDLAYSSQDQAQLVAAFIRSRDLRNLSIIGHSFGGAVAARTALLLAADQDQGRISRLVLMSAPVLPGSLPPVFGFVVRPGVAEALLKPLSPEVVARELLAGARGSSRGISKADIKGYAEPYYEAAAKHAFITTARHVVSDKDAEFAGRLAGLGVPTLLVWCRGDNIVPLAAGEKLARILPSARLETLKGCNHLPQEQRPGAVMSLVEPFLR